MAMKENIAEIEYTPLKFEELTENLQEACMRADWKDLMPVQAHIR